MIVYRERPGCWVAATGGIRCRFQTWAEAMAAADRASLRWLVRAAR